MRDMHWKKKWPGMGHQLTRDGFQFQTDYDVTEETEKYFTLSFLIFVIFYPHLSSIRCFFSVTSRRGQSCRGREKTENEI